MAISNATLFLENLTALKNAAVADGTVTVLVAKNTLGDSWGGFYRWDASSALAEDNTFMNVITSNVSATGRWIRVFQRAKVYPHGILVMNGGVKTFYAPATTDANGEYTLNLTEDNTTNGAAIFTEIWFNHSKSSAPTASIANSVTSYVKSLSGNLKQTTHGYFKANALTLTLGLLYSPFASAGPGVAVQFRIEGV